MNLQERIIDMETIQGMQLQLDKYIFSVREVDKTNYHDNRVIALRVEIAELFNELGFFKDWKKSHEINREKVLDEFADCLYFFCTLANWKGIRLKGYTVKESEGEIDIQRTAWLLFCNKFHITQDFDLLLALMLAYGFTYVEMEAAYIKKNEENFKRMKLGY